MAGSAPRVTAREAITRHEASGRRFTAAGVQSFVLDEGQGDPVVCLHGVPASAYLYRRVVPALARAGLRGIAFDLPGLGLAARPDDFDYSWTGLGAWAAAAVDALDLERFHLVVHDIGGPVGFELTTAMPDRVASLTVLNTLIEVDGFRRPWVMEPFSWPRLGPVYLASLKKPLFRGLMRLQGVQDMAAVPPGELDAYVDLLRRGDRGRAFLRIMRGFEPTALKQEQYVAAVGDTRRPVQVVWGEHDPALPLARYGRVAARVAGVADVVRLPGKHFLQEDQAEPLAQQIARFVQGASS